MVADDVKVPVVDEGPVVLKAEHDVVTTVVHEVVDHGEVNIARVGELQVTNMEGQSIGQTSPQIKVKRSSFSP